MKIYAVYHQAVHTDRMGGTQSFVKAESKKDAMEKFNKIRLRMMKHKDWCYMEWSEVTDLDHVSLLKTLN